jgi:MFS family permease
MPESNSPTPDIVECDSSSITASDNASLNWLRRLNNAERHTWFASSGGLALDAMDSQAYSLAIPSLLIALHLSTAQAGTFATAALVGSGIGGWLFGLLADRFGRIKMLQCSIVVVAVSTFLSAFATQFWHLLVARSLQGIGYGGEAAVGAVLVSEMIRPALRGRVTASVQSGYAVGYALAVGSMALIFHFVPEQTAWRFLFALGILPVFFLLYIRRYVPESPLFLEKMNAPSGKRRNTAVTEIFRGPLLRRTIIATILATAIFGGRICSDNVAPHLSADSASPQRYIHGRVSLPEYSWSISWSTVVRPFE